LTIRVRASKSFKIVPGVRVRVNAKSTSMTVGGKAMHYTVNSRGRRTSTVHVPGTHMSVQQVSGTRRSAPARTAPQAARTARTTPKPGLFAPKGEKRLYQILARNDLGPMGHAKQCEWAAAKYPGVRIAALTLAGLFSLGHDRPMAIRTLEEVYASGIEVAADKFLSRYSPVKSFPIDAEGGRNANVPVSQELVIIRLATLHMLTGNYDRAEALAAEIRTASVAAELRRRIAGRRVAGS